MTMAATLDAADTVPTGTFPKAAVHIAFVRGSGDAFATVVITKLGKDAEIFITANPTMDVPLTSTPPHAYSKEPVNHAQPAIRFPNEDVVTSPQDPAVMAVKSNRKNAPLASVIPVLPTKQYRRSNKVS